MIFPARVEPGDIMKKTITLIFLATVFGSTAFSLGQSNFSLCFSPAGQCDVKINSFAAAAKSTVDIAIYSLTLQSFAQTVVKLSKSGVKIRIVADKGESRTPSSLIANLIKAGIPVKIGNVHGIMHNKFMIVDGRMLETGSFNYTNNASVANAENQIYLDNPDVVKAYQAQFEGLWANGLPPQ
jgi:phosphatidylserine/phosphatidylglycerophosphate/cardiolipin synthase-like enzyme